MIGHKILAVLQQFDMPASLDAPRLVQNTFQLSGNARDQPASM